MSGKPEPEPELTMARVHLAAVLDLINSGEVGDEQARELLKALMAREKKLQRLRADREIDVVLQVESVFGEDGWPGDQS